MARARRSVSSGRRDATLARRRRFGRDVHRRLPVRRGAGPRRGLEGAVDAGRPFARHRRRASRKACAASRPTPATAGGAGRLFRPRHDGRDQRADPASRRARPASSPPTASATCWRSAARSGPISTTSRPTSRRPWCRATCGWRCPSACATPARSTTPLDEDAVRAAARALQGGRREGGRGLLPLRLRAPRAREARASRSCARSCPTPSSAAGHEIAPEFREYERLSTVVLNAYLGPVMARYIERLSAAAGRRSASTADAASHAVQRRRHRLRDGGRDAGAHRAVRPRRPAWSARRRSAALAGLRRPHHLRHGRHLDRRGAAAGRPAAGSPREATVHGYPIKAPMLDIHTVGAGGGSIAYVDSGGLLKVGPRSCRRRSRARSATAGATTEPDRHRRQRRAADAEPRAPAGRPHDDPPATWREQAIARLADQLGLGADGDGAGHPLGRHRQHGAGDPRHLACSAATIRATTR